MYAARVEKHLRVMFRHISISAYPKSTPWAERIIRIDSKMLMLESLASSAYNCALFGHQAKTALALAVTLQGLVEFVFVEIGPQGGGHV